MYVGAIESILLAGSYTPLVPLFSKINADLLSLEFSTPRAGDLSAVLNDDRIRNKLVLGLGVINPRLDTCETVTSIVERANEALTFIENKNLWLNPDCGFATFSNRPVNEYDVIEEKIQNLVSASKILRKSYE